jgi:hypothetical protein
MPHASSLARPPNPNRIAMFNTHPYITNATGLHTWQPNIRLHPVNGGLRHNNIISQEAINFLTNCVWANSLDIYTLTKLMPASAPICLDYKQVAMPMVHPMTGETISSYKRLMPNSTMAEMWQTVFGKDLGGMVQGDLKMGQKGTNSIFVLNHKEISRIPQNQPVTYACVLSTFDHKKADPHCIWITVGKNLINYPGELSTHTADLTTSKLM